MRGEKWWRVRVAWVVYGVGVVMCLGSLGMDAFVYSGVEKSVLDLLTAAPEGVFDGLQSGGMRISEHLEETFPLLGILLSFAVLVPGGFVLWLAQRSRMFFWLGLNVIGVIVFLGPVLVLRVLLSNFPVSSAEEISIELGLWIWCAGVCLTMVAFPVLGRPRDGEVAGDLQGEPAGREGDC